MITIYGIKNCDTVKRARTALATGGVDAKFHDFRVDGLSAELAADLIAALGRDTVINRRGTTWRTLSETDQQSADTDAGAAALIAAYPALVRRPVWHKDGVWRVGFAKKDAPGITAWLQA